MPQHVRLSIVIPCYNEEKTLRRCVERVLQIADEKLQLELIIVDDCSRDASYAVAETLAKEFSGIKLARHQVNQGKGAALHTGFRQATGDFVAVQDADLEYNPFDLKRLLEPLRSNDADVVLGSRFLSGGAHRVLYFWHSMGNRFLTFLSNMFTDLNLTDMETCYKVFRREVIQSIDLQEKRFGFEPEIVAKIARKRLRIYEVGISYSGRTYLEGKKIGVKDGLRALYCIFRYNAHSAPVPIQFMIYVFIGGFSAMINLAVFMALLKSGIAVLWAAPLAFFSAAAVNYYLCVLILFRRKARWNAVSEMIVFLCLVVCVCVVDVLLTKSFISLGMGAVPAKLYATGLGLLLNFLGRRYLVFSEPTAGPWKPQVQD